MKFKIISDMHLGFKNNPSNNFLFDEKIFENYLKNSLETHDYIIFNGDCFELWEDMLNYNLKKPHFVKNHLNKILNSWCFGDYILKEKRIIILNGNHDSLLRFDNTLLDRDIRNHLIIKNQNFSIYIAHGHQGDFFCREWSPITCLVCCASQLKSKVEDLVDDNLDDNVHKLKKCLNSIGSNIDNYGHSIAEKFNYDLVVLGHTHRPTFQNNKEHTYVNTGAISDNTEYISECILNLTQNNLTIHLQKINIHTNNISSFYSKIFIK